MINSDLDGDSAASLILIGRQFHRHSMSNEQNHRDLAIAAIMAHATEPLYDRTYARIEKGRRRSATRSHDFRGNRPHLEEAKENFEEE